MGRVVFPAELVERARRDDEDAFLELFALVRLFVLRLSRSAFGLNATDAEDLFQEVVFSLHRNLAHVEDPAAWLYTACRHAARRVGPSKRESWEERHASLLVDDALEERAMVWESVFKLSPHCKRLILRLVVHEYTEVETARALSMNDRTVHAHKKRCLADLYHLYLGGAYA